MSDSIYIGIGIILLVIFGFIQISLWAELFYRIDRLEKKIDGFARHKEGK